MNPGNSAPHFFLHAFLTALDEPWAAGRIRIEGRGAWAARYPVTDLACASIGAAAMLLARWVDPDHPPLVQLDRPLASWWFGTSLQPLGWVVPKVRDAVTGDYAARDGWIRIHANAAHHRQRALRVMDLPADATREAVQARVQAWSAGALEDALVDQAACAAALRTPAQWRQHPQGEAVAAEPLLHRGDGLSCAGIHRAGRSADGARAWTSPGSGAAGPAGEDSDHPVDPARPLAGLRVLDLTRVLAGPAATRFLAAYGAQVLRLDPADWDEPGMVPEVAVGKRCALLDLHEPAGRAQFERLLAQADVLVHGYRPDALDRLGLGADVRQQMRPGLVDVCLDAWGWTGPWRLRRGFDSLVQMSAGIAWPGSPDRAPDPLPVQALDQATGYWMAACVLKGLIQRRERRCGSAWRVSLARTAALLAQGAEALGAAASGPSEPILGPAAPDAYAAAIEATAWGPARRMRAPCRVGPADWAWDRPSGDLRSSPPVWE
ncbi:CoA transferase [Castellaniella sp.]|uniref:CoA transferase n=1 Tax=Castellaniella sp. TaxID=1955812 RepID=UPI002AFFCDED|nr:CoA transferase [Castellaniella sp.]